MAIKLLVADDEANQTELLRYNLTKAGYEVICAADGLEALTMVENQKPDLVILDWMMPEMSGIDVCRQIRARPDLQKLPIIMLSARGEENDKSLGLDRGADDYIAKPFSPRELVSRVKALLRRTRPEAGDAWLRFGDLEVNTATMQVLRKSQPVRLGTKEFRLLSILMERPEQVFSRTQLLDMVWGHGVYVEDRTVDVHMSRLRKALNKSAQGEKLHKDMIRTVRGMGYALTLPEK